MYLISAFCALVISYVLLKDLDSRVAETAVTFSFITLTSIVGSYVFGAVYDDKNKRAQMPPK